jgi:hypothetical protein
VSDDRTLDYYERLLDVAMSTPHDQRKTFWDSQGEQAKHELAARGFDLSAADESTEDESIPPPPTQAKPRAEAPAPREDPLRKIPTTVDRLKDLGAGELSADMTELVNRAGLPVDASLTDVVGLADRLGVKLDNRALARAAAHAPPAGAMFTQTVDLAPEDLRRIEQDVTAAQKAATRETPAGEKGTYDASGRWRPAPEKAAK